MQLTVKEMPDRRPSDDELWRALRGGEEQALGGLYARWQAPLYRFALQMSGSRTVAEDVTQDTFLALINERGCYEPGRGSLGPYLYGIARHLVLRALRRERTLAVKSAHDSPPASACARDDNPHELAVRRQRAERLWAAVLALPVHYREVVVMCELHDLDYAEAAEALDCSIGTVRSRLHRARALLAERLHADDRPARALGIEPDGCAI